MPEFVLEIEPKRTEWESLSPFVQGFIEAAFFTETASGIPMSEFWDDENQDDIREGRADGCLPSDSGFAELHAEALETIVAFCEAFQTRAADLLRRAYGRDGYDETQAGRDLWFTYNGHGVGYWDRAPLEDQTEEYERLTGLMVAASSHGSGDDKAWQAAFDERAKLSSVSLGNMLSDACGRGEWMLWFGDHVEHGDRAPFVFASHC